MSFFHNYWQQNLKRGKGFIHIYLRTKWKGNLRDHLLRQDCGSHNRMVQYCHLLAVGDLPSCSLFRRYLMSLKVRHTAQMVCERQFLKGEVRGSQKERVQSYSFPITSVYSRFPSHVPVYHFSGGTNTIFKDLTVESLSTFLLLIF